MDPLFIAIHINPSAAVKAGMLRAGRHAVPVTSTLLEALTPEERDRAAHYITTEKDPSKVSWPLTVEPPADEAAILAAIRREAAAAAAKHEEGVADLLKALTAENIRWQGGQVYFGWQSLYDRTHAPHAAAAADPRVQARLAELAPIIEAFKAEHEAADKAKREAEEAADRARRDARDAADREAKARAAAAAAQLREWGAQCGDPVLARAHTEGLDIAEQAFNYADDLVVAALSAAGCNVVTLSGSIIEFAPRLTGWLERDFAALDAARAGTKAARAGLPECVAVEVSPVSRITAGDGRKGSKFTGVAVMVNCAGFDGWQHAVASDPTFDLERSRRLAAEREEE